MVSDRSRQELFLALEEQLGPRPAETLMELLPPVGWADVARRADITQLRGEIAELRGELRGEIAELRAELRGEMAELRGELRGEMAELRGDLRGEMAELRSELKGDIADLKSQMSGLFPKLLAAQLGTTFAFGGMLVGAVALVA